MQALQPGVSGPSVSQRGQLLSQGLFIIISYNGQSNLWTWTLHLNLRGLDSFGASLGFPWLGWCPHPTELESSQLPLSLAVTLTADGSCLNFEVMPLTTPSPNTHMLPTTEVWPSSFIVGAFLWYLYTSELSGDQIWTSSMHYSFPFTFQHPFLPYKFFLNKSINQVSLEPCLRLCFQRT